MKTRTLVLMWDCYGLESIDEVPDPALLTWARLSDQPPPKYPNIEHWKLRARYNSQRHYEIYVVTVDACITQQAMRKMFDDSPQAMADLVRERGQCLHSDRQTQQPVIV